MASSLIRLIFVSFSFNDTIIGFSASAVVYVSLFLTLVCAFIKGGRRR